ncbi:cytochrome P450 [Xylariaceae sp. FL0255]|nr:cytochrome P450 [Xylariaceae sp. FL0255]
MADHQLLNSNSGPRPLAGLAYTILLAGVLVYIIRRLFFNPLSKIPGPWYTNLTGIVFKIHTSRGYGPIYVDDLHKKYGPIVRTGPSSVDIMDLEGVKRIHRVKADYVKSDFYKGVPPGKENMHNTQDKEMHRRHRKLLSAPISESGLKPKIPLIEVKVRLMVERMREEMKNKGTVDVFKWWLFMTTDVIAQLTFGQSFEMLESGKINEFVEDLQVAGPIASFASQFCGLANFVVKVKIPFMGSMRDQINRMSVYSQTQLDNLKEKLDNNAVDEEQYLMSRLVRGLTLDGESMSEIEVVRDAELYIVAGSDTTSNTLTYVTWSICRDPSLRDRVVAELSALPPNFTDSDLKQLSLLNQCITEGLRCFPVVAGGLPRIVPEEGAAFGNGKGKFWVPGGTEVTTQNWSLHRNPEVFPEPQSFRPERWDKERTTQEMRDSWMPFGGGSRNCIGMHLAYIEMRLGLAYFFRAFPDSKVSTKEGMCDADMEQALYFIASPRKHRCLIDVA